MNVFYEQYSHTTVHTQFVYINALLHVYNINIFYFSNNLKDWLGTSFLCNFCINSINGHYNTLPSLVTEPLKIYFGCSGSFQHNISSD